MALNTTTSLSGQYQNYFSKKLLTYAVQALVLDQFAEKAPLPAKSGHHTISMFRFDTPSTGAIETLGTEGTAPTGTRTLTLTKISKALIQRGQIVKLTDVLNATDLFNSLAQSIKINGQDAALDMDTQTRNTLVGSNVAGDAKENGDGSALDNSDTLSEMYANGGTDYSTFDAVETDATILAASSILDAVTKLKVNRAQPAKGGMYVAATSPQVLSDIMKVDAWLNAAQYSNVQELYKGEVGSLYGAKFIMHTNGWSSVYSSSDDDRFAYSVAGSGTTAAGANIRATLFLGEQAFGVPELSSQSPFSPKVIITDTADKTDPLNQLTTAGFKVFWTTLRLNPNYYVIMRSKTASTA
jgi:N4-gp56 family major capsid protein